MMEAANYCLWKENCLTLQNNRDMTMKRLESAERNLQRKIVRGEGLPLKVLSRRNTKKGWTLLIVALIAKKSSPFPFAILLKCVF